MTQNQNFQATCWSSESDTFNEAAAKYMVTHAYVESRGWIDIHTIVGSCASSTADVQVSGHKRYNLWMTTYGFSFCGCPKFSKTNLACKHLWAFRLHILGTLSSDIQAFYFATTPEESQNLLLIYGLNTTASSSNSGPVIPLTDTPQLPEPSNLNATGPLVTAAIPHVTLISDPINEYTFNAMEDLPEDEHRHDEDISTSDDDLSASGDTDNDHTLADTISAGAGEMVRFKL